MMTEMLLREDKGSQGVNSEKGHDHNSGDHSNSLLVESRLSEELVLGVDVVVEDGILQLLHSSEILNGLHILYFFYSLSKIISIKKRYSAYYTTI